MKEFVEYVAKYLVDHPDGVNVEEAVNEEKKFVLSLRVHSEDIGKVIGKRRSVH